LLNRILLMILKIMWGTFSLFAGGSVNVEFEEIPKRSIKAAWIIFAIIVVLSLIALLIVIFAPF
jgi:hypothetical protein